MKELQAIDSSGKSMTTTTSAHNGNINPSSSLPLVVYLNCLEDCNLEQEFLAGIATVEHVGLNRLANGLIESAAAVILHSLSFLPRAAQRRLQPWQVILCLGSSDRSVESALAADLGLRLVHVDVCRAEEIADTVMALFLGLVRRTHLLSRHAFSASGWLGSLQPLCRGMRRCRVLVLGIVGRSASARSLATRSLAFKMSVLYFDVQEAHTEGKEKSGRPSITFPSAARRMDTLSDLLAASDLISLHCTLSNETVQIINAECLQHIKPGAFLVNTGSSQLLDDCALKQLLIDGTIAGCALDGAEGPQWMEAWVREMPNVLILPRSADYSEEVWIEIREKAISLLQMFFVDGVVPNNAISAEDDAVSETGYEDEQSEKLDRESASRNYIGEQLTDDVQLSPENYQKKGKSESCSLPQASGVSKNQAEGRHSKSGKKSKKRHTCRKSQQKFDDLERNSSFTSRREDDTALSGTDQVLSSSSQEDSKSRKIPVEHITESTSERLTKSNYGISIASGELLKDGYVIALHVRGRPALYVSRQRVPDCGWFLDTMSDVTRRDPAAQFLVVLRSKDTIGLRSFAAGGKLLQLNRRMEFVFASHSFDIWESWTLEGSLLEECRLVNCRNPLATLDVCIDILATVGDDGVARWLD
ncbi:hypothetical protein NE237_027697 [Protea cynaroides]|uniref:D-isomer specific 2-hydroxyacid dehydrogenase NAD-binding domain-containing protein n=1 Tax=Protea cynaroides TaxID=273540 RepID=A0A9Q0GNV5_9MAGN|nr:hypothetical protein NE237_027697 [Protea cynaroides]